MSLNSPGPFSEPQPAAAGSSTSRSTTSTTARSRPARRPRSTSSNDSATTVGAAWSPASATCPRQVTDEGPTAGDGRAALVRVPQRRPVPRGSPVPQVARSTRRRTHVDLRQAPPAGSLDGPRTRRPVPTLGGRDVNVPYPIALRRRRARPRSTSATSTRPHPSCRLPASIATIGSRRRSSSSSTGWHLMTGRRVSPTATCRPTTCCGGTTGSGSSTFPRPSTSPPTPGARLPPPRRRQRVRLVRAAAASTSTPRNVFAEHHRPLTPARRDSVGCHMRMTRAAISPAAAVTVGASSTSRSGVSRTLGPWTTDGRVGDPAPRPDRRGDAAHADVTLLDVGRVSTFEQPVSSSAVSSVRVVCVASVNRSSGPSALDAVDDRARRERQQHLAHRRCVHRDLGTGGMVEAQRRGPRSLARSPPPRGRGGSRG